MNLNFSKPSLHVVTHLVTWLLLGFLLMFHTPMSWGVVVPTVFWLKQVFVLILMTGLFYFNGLIVVPKTALKNRIPMFILWVISIAFLLQLLAYIYNVNTHIRALMSNAFGNKMRRESPFDIFDGFVFMITLVVLGISTVWTMLRNLEKTTELRRQLQQQQTIAELTLLKAQISPHFFFNTLNNIYALTYIDIDDARRALHTLSRMMRYLLYHTNDTKTLLSKELDFIDDYITLMRMRTDRKTRLLVSLPKQVPGYVISPMLLLPFIENAFKHGIDALQPSDINILVAQEGNQLRMEVRNEIFKQQRCPIEAGGIGLANTRRRLELMYPGRHKLYAGVGNDGRFDVMLDLELENL